MEDAPEFWAEYARLQEQLSKKTRVDHFAWGLEAALNLTLASNFDVSTVSQADLERAVATGTRRERYRAQLSIRYLRPTSVDNTEDFDAVENRSELSIIKSLVPGSDWDIFCALADGYQSSEVARALKRSPGAIRARTLRARRLVRRAIGTSHPDHFRLGSSLAS